MPRLTIIGAGTTGLVTAVSAAERGWDVVMHESRPRAGGRARTEASAYRANVGPHGIYIDGVLWSWLTERKLQPCVVAPSDTIYRVGGAAGAAPPEGLHDLLRGLSPEAPSDLSFRDWLIDQGTEPSATEALIGLLFIVFYDADPGRLSAEFVLERLRRGFGGSVRYVVGGWQQLVNTLQERAEALGVELHTSSPVRRIPEGPTVIATTLDAARRLTRDPSLTWPSGHVALLDLGLIADRAIQWFRVFDVDERSYLARFSAVDPSLAPEGHELIQAATGVRPGEDDKAAIARLEQLMEQVWPNWERAVRWRRSSVLRQRTGALDLPGFTWHDRPAVIRRPGLAVCTDQSSAPGLLAEVGVSAALTALEGLER